MAVVVDVAGGRRAEMLSWFSSITIIGNLIGAPLGGFLLTALSDGGPNQLRAEVEVLRETIKALSKKL